MTEAQSPVVAIFGATGAIGGALTATFRSIGWRVLGVSRQPPQADDAQNWVQWTYGGGAGGLEGLPTALIQAVVWAQGINFSDDVRTYDAAAHAAMYEANVLVILESLQQMLRLKLLDSGARLCIISSIWQDLAREKKLSYCVTKSALKGLVQSLAIDLGRDGILVNAVLPGALDTPMTRANLEDDQIDRLKQMAPLRSLPQLADVANLVTFLCSAQNTGLTGQFVSADRGFSYAKFV
ncbi:MAG: SDR family NAD(P)-dependent oxidoreductase [Bradyrhizobium sp.]|nr:SDR family NAD(P)-dependent oxidoreductase [Bradyrhizobium sp.]